MGMVESEGKMQGWLYLIRFNQLGMQYSRKRYFILEDNCLKSFKSIPISDTEEPVRSAIIDSCIRVTDNGRESHHRKVFFIFTLCNTSNHNDQLKLGAISSEEAARWIRSLQDAALNPGKNLEASSKRKWQPFSLSVSKGMANESFIKWTSASSLQVHAMTSDVIVPSPWKIFGCRNGFRLFKEAEDRDCNGRHLGDHPAIMAVGVIDGTSEAVFHTVMSLGPSRTEWDFCFYRGCVVEHLDGHTDIIHIQLYNHWLPWAMKRRDLLLRRYWRREDDGTYVILYHSVFHRKCPPQRGYVRAYFKSGGFVISPVKQGKKCVVKHMVAADWRIWKSYLMKAYARTITISFLERVGALRELFRAKGESNSHEFFLGEITREIEVPHCEKEDIKTEIDLMGMESVREDEPRPSNLMGLNDAVDEFFDVPEPSDDEQSVDERPLITSTELCYVGLNDAVDEFFDVPEPSDDEQSVDEWPLITSTELCYVDTYQPKLQSAANFVKKLHDLAVQKKGYTDLQGMSLEENTSCSYGATLPKDPNLNMPSSWAAADPSSFLIRGDNYLEDRQKIKAEGTLMQMVAADWLRSDTREDELASRPGGIVQQHAAQGRPEFFLVVNMQIPGTNPSNLALYYMLTTPLEETPLLERFVNGDDAFRNSRFKLIPYISKGSWIVKQSVGKTAGLVGQRLEIHYVRGKNYLELDIDIGSSRIARGVASLVFGYLNNLVVEIAFLLQGNTEEELPEFLLGTCQLNHLDVSKTVSTDSIGIS